MITFFQSSAVLKLHIAISLHMPSLGNERPAVGYREYKLRGEEENICNMLGGANGE